MYDIEAAIEELRGVSFFAVAASLVASIKRDDDEDDVLRTPVVAQPIRGDVSA